MGRAWAEAKSPGKKQEEVAARLAQRSQQPSTRMAAYFGQQAIEGHELLTQRRQRESQPRPQGSDKVRKAAQKMAKRAEEKPLPTTFPSTIMGVVQREETVGSAHTGSRALAKTGHGWRRCLSSTSRAADLLRLPRLTCRG